MKGKIILWNPDPPSGYGICDQEIPQKKLCPNCVGDDEKLSDCCGASAIGNGDNDSIDYGICPECHDHCEFTACETCGGTGEIEI